MSYHSIQTRNTVRLIFNTCGVDYNVYERAYIYATVELRKVFPHVVTNLSQGRNNFLSWLVDRYSIEHVVDADWHFSTSCISWVYTPDVPYVVNRNNVMFKDPNDAALFRVFWG